MVRLAAMGGAGGGAFAAAGTGGGAGGGAAAGAGGGAAACGIAPDCPTPTIVGLCWRGGAAVGAVAPAVAGGGPAAGLVTRNECPHLGHLIFSPVGGTRRSSIWYGALHDSHSTLSIGEASVSRGHARQP
jgi:hypothetical protein